MVVKRYFSKTSNVQNQNCFVFQGGHCYRRGRKLTKHEMLVFSCLFRWWNLALRKVARRVLLSKPGIECRYTTPMVRSRLPLQRAKYCCPNSVCETILEDSFKRLSIFFFDRIIMTQVLASIDRCHKMQVPTLFQSLYFSSFASVLGSVTCSFQIPVSTRWFHHGFLFHHVAGTVVRRVLEHKHSCPPSWASPSAFHRWASPCLALTRPSSRSTTGNR